MKITELLENLQSKHPNFEAISNLLSHLSLPNLSPDILIDLAHSLNEGAAKNYRFLTDKSINKRRLEKETNTSKHWNAVRTKLPNSEVPIELFETIHLVFEEIRKMRNEHGDISHGHIGTKKYTDVNTARLLFDLSLAHSRYIFGCANEIEAEQIPYEKYHEFNCYLDDLGQSIGTMTYSQLIYKYDYQKYIDELERFDPEIYNEDNL